MHLPVSAASKRSRDISLSVLCLKRARSFAGFACRQSKPPDATTGTFCRTVVFSPSQETCQHGISTAAHRIGCWAAVGICVQEFACRQRQAATPQRAMRPLDGLKPAIESHGGSLATATYLARLHHPDRDAAVKRVGSVAKLVSLIPTGQLTRTMPSTSASKDSRTKPSDVMSYSRYCR